MTTDTQRSSLRRPLMRLGLWARKVGLQKKLAVTLAIAALLSGVATYAAFTGAGPLGPEPGTVLILLNINLVLFLLLGAVVARRIVRLWAERRKGSAGSRLHVRLVVLFSLVAVAPAILVTGFSALFFNIGVEAWFNERVQTALSASKRIAQEYLNEHKQIIAGDVLVMANEINRQAPVIAANPFLMDRILANQSIARGLTEAVVFAGDGRVLSRSGYTHALQFEQVPFWALERADRGEVAVLTGEADDRVRGLVRLDSFTDAYLYVGRFVDPEVIGHIERTETAVAAYERLEGRRSGLEITLTLIFMIVALLLLLAGIWVGLMIANRLARPIMALIDAAERVREGDLNARVPEGTSSDEIGSLSRAFNRMTDQLGAQRRDLIEANRELDERRRFTETVLAGVSAGVIGLDPTGRIHLPNRSACEMLGVSPQQVQGKHLAEVSPELAELLDAAQERSDRLVQREIRIARRGRSPRILHARLAAERLDDEIIGHVVTFDDITELQSAQRKAAWADVARRIAHEIKNPLTPIQLSAERLKRKYLKQIGEDPDTFVACTDTIVRQVGDMRRMVDEFSNFARMPAPQLKRRDLRDLVRQAAVLQRQAFPEITFAADLPEEPLPVECDSAQIDQMLTNLIKNAVESIQARHEMEGGAPAGTVHLKLERRGNGGIRLVVEDNGRGLPPKERERLTEPYVTTRSKGTGLGLAIVKKIMEDHGGHLLLEDRVGGGARIVLNFPEAEALPTKTVPIRAAEGTHGA